MTSQTTEITMKAESSPDIKKTATWIASIGIWFLPLIWIDPTTYLVLTVAGLAMGMLLFLCASGLTLIFGLMDVLNMAHGGFFVFGAYFGFSTLNWLNSLGWVETGTMGQSILSILIALCFSIGGGLVLGLILERVIIRQVYGDHLKQILITMGAALVMAEIVKIFWGPNDEVVLVPAGFVGSYDVMDVIINKFRVVAIVVGLAVFAGIQLVLMKTKLGIIVRAGVENQEVVQSLGYNIRRIFTGVFCAGAALAAVGGVHVGHFQGADSPGHG